MGQKPKNRFSGLTAIEWEKEAKKPDSNPESYKTGKVIAVMGILSLLIWIGIIYSIWSHVPTVN